MDKHIDKHLEEIQLNEFIVMPTVIVVMALYKKYLSKAAQSCANYQSKDKKKCILQYQIKARQMQLSELKKIIGKCSEDKQPEKCKESVKKKSQKIFEHLQKLIEQYKKLG